MCQESPIDKKKEDNRLSNMNFHNT